MIERLQRALDRRTSATEYGECRQCGTTVDTDTARCPDCGSAEIASYTF
ncbi:hypothetical protein SAMN05216559_2226 [Halomicrobium zhouii]|uniref:Small CPxCG-related zinc finger protein n=1 Tax=Halomicrobium zhouii TaxID=767519 RepID=A0A1I6L7U8_9EURY|nr:hypothetical protein [Halomicrobium zhouii]SFR99546.1 hypothetical protein SAMN05216559_2226 [Halomicrobium zhouii]